MAPSRWIPGRRAARALVGAAGVLAVLVGLSGFLIGPIIGRKLVAMVQDRINGKLRLGLVIYQPPYGLIIKGCHLTVPSGDGQEHNLIDIAEVDISLARLPFHGGPLVIDGLHIQDPVLHVIRTVAHTVAGADLVKPKAPPSTPSPRQRFSDLLRLRHLTIENAQVVYEDQSRPEMPPMQWAGIDVKVNTAQKGPAAYTFDMHVASRDTVDATANGAFDVDQPALTIDALSFMAQVRRDQPPQQLPPQVQELLRKYQINGRLKIDASAQLAKADAGGARFKATANLDQGSALVPPGDTALNDLHLSLSIEGSASRLTATVHEFSASARDAVLMLKDNALVTIDLADKQWSVARIDGALKLLDVDRSDPSSHPLLKDCQAHGALEFTAAAKGPLRRINSPDDIDGEMLIYPRKLLLFPKAFSVPVTGITGGPIRVVGNVLSVRDITAHFGKDQWTVNSARLALSPLAQGVMRWTEITGFILFNPRSPKYPDPLGDVFSLATPSGEYDLSGSLTSNPHPIAPRPKVDYDLLISSDHGGMSVAGGKIKLTEIAGDTELFPDHLEINRLVCSVWGGRMGGHGWLQTKKPCPFNGEVQADKIQLAQIAGLLHAKSDGDVNLNGLGNILMTFQGSGPTQGRRATDLFTGSGQVEVYHGQFWQFPLFTRLAEKTGLGVKSVTVANAAAFFKVANRTVTLSDVAVNAPLLGLDGSGTVTFDSELNLEVVAAPLANWRDKLQRTGIPIVSDLAGDVFGEIQTVINQTTGSLLYEFHVTGPASDPQVQTVAAPMLTRAAAGAFGNMLKGSDDKPIALLQSGAATQPGH